LAQLLRQLSNLVDDRPSLFHVLIEAIFTKPNAIKLDNGGIKAILAIFKVHAIPLA
jgi:hypothetical protein